MGWAPDLPSGMQDIVSIMLIFLDEEDAFFRRPQSGSVPHAAACLGRFVRDSLVVERVFP
jgi:hypothetical protein